MAAIKDLREFIALLESEGPAASASRRAVDPNLEIGEITDRVSKQVGPALLFENPVNRETGERVRDAGGDQPDGQLRPHGVGARRRRRDGHVARSRRRRPSSSWTCCRSTCRRSMKDKLDILDEPQGPRRRRAPRRSSKAPVQEVVLRGDDVDLTKLPVLTTWPEDGGPFVTLPLVVTSNPKGKLNVGMYRLQVFDQQHDRAAHPRAPRRREEPARVDGGRASTRVPVSVALGARPGHDLLGDRAGAADDRRVPVRRHPARRAGRGRQVRDERPAGARARRDRARGLVRSGGDALGGSVRRPHRLLLARRLLPGLPRRGDHDAPRRDLPDDDRRAVRRWRTATWPRPPSASSCRSSRR